HRFANRAADVAVAGLKHRAADRIVAGPIAGLIDRLADRAADLTVAGIEYRAADRVIAGPIAGLVDRLANRAADVAIARLEDRPADVVADIAIASIHHQPAARDRHLLVDPVIHGLVASVILLFPYDFFDGLIARSAARFRLAIITAGRAG